MTFDDSQRNKNGYVTVKTLADFLNKLIKEGKGDYEVLVEFHRLNECDIDKTCIDLCN